MSSDEKLVGVPMADLAKLMKGMLAAVPEEKKADHQRIWAVISKGADTFDLFGDATRMVNAEEFGTFFAQYRERRKEHPDKLMDLTFICFFVLDTNGSAFAVQELQTAFKDMRDLK